MVCLGKGCRWGSSILPSLANRLVGPFHPAQIVFLAGRQQQSIQVVKVSDLWHGHQEIAPRVAYITLDTALFVALSWRAETALEQVVAAKTSKGPLVPLAGVLVGCG